MQNDRCRHTGKIDRGYNDDVGTSVTVFENDNLVSFDKELKKLSCGEDWQVESLKYHEDLCRSRMLIAYYLVETIDGSMDPSNSCGQPVTAIRALLRFLVARGVIQQGLERAVHRF